MSVCEVRPSGRDVRFLVCACEYSYWQVKFLSFQNKNLNLKTAKMSRHLWALSPVDGTILNYLTSYETQIEILLYWNIFAWPREMDKGIFLSYVITFSGIWLSFIHSRLTRGPHAGCTCWSEWLGSFQRCSQLLRLPYSATWRLKLDLGYVSSAWEIKKEDANMLITIALLCGQSA